MNKKSTIGIAVGAIIVIAVALVVAIMLSNPSLFSSSPTQSNNNPPPTTASSSPPPQTTLPTSKPATAPPTHAPTTSPTTQPTQPATSSPAPSTTTPSPTITSPSPAPTLNPASVVFSDSFASGTTSAWTGTDASNVNLNVKNQTVQFSTNSSVSNQWGYVYKWLNKSYSSLDWRWYVFFGNLPTTDGNIIGAGGMYNSAIEGNFTPTNGVCSLSVVRQSGAWYWNLAYVDGNSVNSKNSTSTVAANTWYLVELKGVQGAGNGEVHFYLNDVETLNATTLTNNRNTGINHVSVGGGVTADQAVSWAAANALASTDHIGPQVSTSTVALMNSTSALGLVSATGLVTALSVAILAIAFPAALWKLKKNNALSVIRRAL